MRSKTIRFCRGHYQNQRGTALGRGNLWCAETLQETKFSALCGSMVASRKVKEIYLRSSPDEEHAVKLYLALEKLPGAKVE